MNNQQSTFFKGETMKTLLSLLTLVALTLPVQANADSLRRRCKRYQPRAIGILADGTYLDKGEFSVFRSTRMAEEAGYTPHGESDPGGCEPTDTNFSGTWILNADLVEENCTERGLDVNETMTDRYEVNHSGRLVVVSAVHSVAGGTANEEGFSFKDIHIAYHHQEYVGLLRAEFDAVAVDDNSADVTAIMRIEVAGLSCEMTYEGDLQRVQR
jgi:hypothetical protein